MDPEEDCMEAWLGGWQLDCRGMQQSEKDSETLHLSPFYSFKTTLKY